jgi:hypothetical protein
MDASLQQWLVRVPISKTESTPVNLHRLIVVQPTGESIIRSGIASLVIAITWKMNRTGFRRLVIGFVGSHGFFKILITDHLIASRDSRFQIRTPFCFTAR